MTQRKTTLFSRVHEILSELDDAQRRLFEIRTGVRVADRSRQTAEVSSLKARSF